MKWRLGLDVGTNSIGWAALKIIGESGQTGKPTGLLDSGVRIFSDGRDPKSKESLAATRREPRGARRNRDRYIKRRSEFMDRLIAHGLMPNDQAQRKALENLDPWALRVRGLDEQLSLYELGRALFHLQQRRGFKSNRKTDKGNDEKGAIKQAELKVLAEMQEQGARTLGEYLAKPRILDPKAAATTLVRARPTVVKNKNTYDFYPTRAMIEREFNKLWDRQKQFHGAALTDTAHRELGDLKTGTLFFQRPLKPQPVGKCALAPYEEERAPKALASVQALRIYQEVNHLMLRQPGLAERKLTVDERDKIVTNLMTSPAVKFDRIRKTLLKIPDASFSIEGPKVKDLKGDLTAAILAQKPSASVCGRWGPKWRDLPLDQQDAIVEILIGMEPFYANDKPNEAFAPAVQSITSALGLDKDKAKKLLSTNNEQVVIDWLVADFGFSQARAEAIESAPIPPGHGRLCRTASRALLPWLQSDAQNIKDLDPKKEVLISAPFTYDQAARLAGYSHTPTQTGEVFDQLPYYGEVLERSVAFGTGDQNHKLEKRIGKIANPTVHVALNQIRAVVNALAKRYGTPYEIVVEVARDLPLSAQGKKDKIREQAKNQQANERRIEEMAPYVTNNYENRMRMRLWEELNEGDRLNRCCVYTGEQIGIERLFSAAVEIEHILPRSRTLDDGFGNKTVSMLTANRYKGQKTPFEAFGASPGEYDWEAISLRADHLPDSKKGRFGPDAMARYDEKEKGFLARQLGDTRYIARLAREYLTKMSGPDRVWVTTGHLTADLRHAWRLNSVLAGHNRSETEAGDVKKNRNDHRHHALDAVVIALIDQACLQKVATAAGNAERLDQAWFKGWPEPEHWQGSFRDDVMASMDKIIVSHKANHGIEGELHEGTNYGPITDPISGETRLAYRKSLVSLTEAELKRIGDHRIRGELEQLVYALDQDEIPSKQRAKELQTRLQKYSDNTGHKRVRLHKVQADFEIIKHNGHQKAVIPGENYCVDLVETKGGKWHGVGVTRFAANRQKRLKAETPIWKAQYPDAKHIMRVRKGDLLMLEKDGREQVMRVVKLQPSSNNFAMVDHLDAGVFQVRHDDIDDSFRWYFATFSKLKPNNARLVHIDPSGKLYDPGPLS